MLLPYDSAHVTNREDSTPLLGTHNIDWDRTDAYWVHIGMPFVQDTRCMERKINVAVFLRQSGPYIDCCVVSASCNIRRPLYGFVSRIVHTKAVDLPW